MKKSLAIIILSVFVISLMGSVLPEVQSIVVNWDDGQKYASSNLPTPPVNKPIDNLAKK